MFKAFVTICIISMPQNCQILEDTRGPYETNEECKQRALEISRQVYKYYPAWKPVKYSCKELPIGRLQWKIWF